MKTLNFKKNSWHHRLAKMGGFDRTCNQDFCTYTQRVLVGTFFFCILSVICVFIAGCFGDFIAWIIAMIKFGVYIEPNVFAQGVTVTIFVCSLMAMFVGYLRWKEKRRERLYALQRAGEYVEPKPSFIAKAYESFKNKTCFKIKLT